MKPLIYSFRKRAILVKETSYLHIFLTHMEMFKNSHNLQIKDNSLRPRKGPGFFNRGTSDVNPVTIIDLSRGSNSQKRTESETKHFRF